MINFYFFKKIKNFYLFYFFKKYLFFFEFFLIIKKNKKNFIKKNIFLNFFLKKNFFFKIYFSLFKKIFFLFLFFFLKKIIIKKSKKIYFLNYLIKLKKKEIVIFTSDFNLFNFNYKKLLFSKIKLKKIINKTQKKIFYKKKKLFKIKYILYSKKKINIIGFIFIKKKIFFSYYIPYWFNFNIKKIKKFINFYYKKKKHFLIKRYFIINFFFSYYIKKNNFFFSKLNTKNKILNFNNIFINNKLFKNLSFIKDKFNFLEISNCLNKKKLVLVTKINNFIFKKEIFNFFFKININFEFLNFYKKKIFFIIKNYKIIYLGFYVVKKKFFKQKIFEFYLKNIKKNFFYKKKISFKIKIILINYVNYFFNYNNFFFLKKKCFNKKKLNGNINLLCKIKNLNLFIFKKKYYIFNIKISI